MQAWAEQRAVVKRFIQTQLVDGTDYYTLQIGQRASKPTLSKAGSEKFLGLFQFHAMFTQDTATWTMFGNRRGRCATSARCTRAVGKSWRRTWSTRGAQERRTSTRRSRWPRSPRRLTQCCAREPSARRLPRTSDQKRMSLSETPAKPTSADLRKRIWAHVYKAAPEVKTQDAARPGCRSAPAWTCTRTITRRFSVN